MTLELYKPPNPRSVYCYGLDPSAGRGGDPGCLIVVDAHAHEEVACFRSKKAGYQTLAELALALHEHGYRVYRGYAPIGRSGGLVPEVNSGNEALVLVLSSPGFFPDDYFYWSRTAPTATHPDGKPSRMGLWTTRGSKKTMLDQFAVAAEQGLLTWHDPYLTQELGHWKAAGDGWDFLVPKQMYEVVGHGDVTIAWGLAWQGVLAADMELSRRQRIPAERAANAVYADWRDSPLVDTTEAFRHLVREKTPVTPGIKSWQEAMRQEGRLV